MVEKITNSCVAEEILKGLCCLVAKEPAEFGVEGGQGVILSRARAFASIEAMVSG